MARIGTDGERLLPLDGCFNFRDLGGYSTKNGKRVRWRRLFRADGPHALSDRDAARLGELGLRTIVDLRTVDEANERGRYTDRVGATEYHHLPLFDALPSEHEIGDWVDPGYVADEYGRIARAGATAIATTLSVLAGDRALPAMFHCSAGKDRTGVVAAVVLGVLGVPDDVIVADYALSRDAMVRMLGWMTERATDPARLERYAPGIRSAAPESMRRFLDGISAQYGSFSGYTDALGIADTVEPLRAALLE